MEQYSRVHRAQISDPIATRDRDPYPLSTLILRGHDLSACLPPPLEFAYKYYSICTLELHSVRIRSSVKNRVGFVNHEVATCARRRVVGAQDEEGDRG